VPRTRLIAILLTCAVIASAWLGYSLYRTEMQSRKALAYPAERVVFRLTALTRFAEEIPEEQWAETSTRTWLYDSVMEIERFGLAAELIPSRGLPSQVAAKLGQLARKMPIEAAHRVAFGDPTQARQARAAIQDLARQINAAGWDPAIRGGSTPAGWTYGRDWAELNGALERLLQ
jgi:hypothetical protein